MAKSSAQGIKKGENGKEYYITADGYDQVMPNRVERERERDCVCEREGGWGNCTLVVKGKGQLWWHVQVWSQVCVCHDAESQGLLQRLIKEFLRVTSLFRVSSEFLQSPREVSLQSPPILKAYFNDWSANLSLSLSLAVNLAQSAQLLQGFLKLMRTLLALLLPLLHYYLYY